MPKLLLLTTDLLRGGTPTVVREVAVRLRQRGHQVEVASLAPPGPVSEEIAASGVPVHAFNATGPSDIGVFGRLHRLLSQHSYDRVLSLLIHANFAAALVSPLHRHVRFFQSIQTTQPHPAWHWTLQGRIHRAARRILVPSQAVADLAITRCNIPAGKLMLIPNAINATAFSKLPRTSFSDRFRIVFVGRLDPVKRIPDLIAAFARLPAGRFALDLYGEGAERPHLESLVAQLPDSHRAHITLHGAIPSPTTALASADLLVLPSQAEGFGLVLLEAMAAGVPVVASAAPGITDLCRHEHNALLFPVGDVQALSAAITRVSSSPELRARLVETARQETLPQFTWDRVLPAYESTLELR